LNSIDREDNRIAPSIPGLPVKEAAQVLYEWNNTHADYPRELTLHELVSAQASASPEHIAARFEEQSITYAELENRSDELALHLRSQGVEAETLVGLYVQRSLDMVIGLLGILKAGGAFVPLDPDFPAERIDLMLEDAQPSVVVSDQPLSLKLDFERFNTVVLNDGVIGKNPPDQGLNNEIGDSKSAAADNLAYVIYTSGSTGRPKGVQITHRSIVNLLTSIKREPGIEANDRMLAVATLSFDISLVEIFLPLISGAQVIIASREAAKDGVKLKHLLVEHDITFMEATPATWRLLLESEWEGKDNLRAISTGEALPTDLAEKLLPRCKALWNMYGPTETTIWSTFDRVKTASESITIGRPIDNTQIYILDDMNHPVSIGEIGHLYIGGDGVARGYLNRPTLTAERFVPNPFTDNVSRCSPVIYRTGDLARFSPDGRINYLGRNDFQVKIRGYRIELGDIEAAISRHPAVSHNVTIAREDAPGDKRLVSYLIPESGNPILDARELRRYLSTILPEYMIPARFVFLDRLPVLPNGKVDRHALPKPDPADFERGREIALPRNQLESELTRVFAKILLLSRAGIYDSFFELGGNSLLAARLVTQLKREFGVGIPLGVFFQNPTVAGLSNIITAKRDRASEPLNLPQPEPAEREKLVLDEVEDLLSRSNLARNQFLMWMGQKINPDIPLYNVVQAFSIQGGLDIDTFQRAFQTLVDHNDALRTVILEIEGVPQQHVLENVAGSLEFVDLSSKASPEASYRAWLDGRKGNRLSLDERLFDSALIKLASDRYVWYLCQHHIITDALSGDLIFKRVSSYYTAALEDRIHDIATPKQYAEYLEYERGIRQTSEYLEAVAYWQQVSSAPFSPTEFYGNSGHQDSFLAKRVTVELGPERSAALREIAQQGSFASPTSDLSLFTVFATVLFVTLHRISGQNDLRLGTPFHGRPFADSQEIIGLFIEMGLLQVEIERGETFASLGKKVMDATFAGLSHLQPGTSSADLNRAYDVIINFIQPSFTDFAGLPVTYEWLESGYIDSPHSLRLQVTDFEGSGIFSISFDMKAAVFDETARSSLVSHFMKVLDALISSNKQSIGAFSLLSAREHQHLLLDFNKSDAPYPLHRTVVQLFEDQTAQTPENIAAVHGNEIVTYAELNRRTNRLAHYLREQGVGPESVVAICMERSIDVLVAFWGVLKAGGAYIPIDPAYPLERIAFMIEDADPKIVLTSNEGSLSELDFTTGSQIIDPRTLDLVAYSASNSVSVAGPNDLAYLIYTSGSTGKPKGTMITHRGLLNYAWWARYTYQAGEALDFPLYSSLAFDLTVTSVFVPLISGGRIAVYSESDYARGLEILAVFEDDAVDVVKLTPAHLNLVLEAGTSTQHISKLIVGGEDFKTELALAALKAFGNHVEIYNEYGPTEAVVGCMSHKFDPDQDTGISVPIGVPASNARIYLLDAYDQPVPPGMIGEMVISGDGVARGYINRPDLSAERFGNDPFRDGARIYRTGDIGRWDEQGQLGFLGRRDHQVKIRGARIELGEIESALQTHPYVEVAVVDAVEHHYDSHEVRHCVLCGLPSNSPEAGLDSHNVCADCRAYAQYRHEVARYFRTPQDLRILLKEVKDANSTQDYDCMVLLSGGKDSTYMLYQLVREYGMRPLVFSLDNGYISEQALDNIRRMCADLDVDLEIASTDHMNAIFADSLRRHSNVCDGCYKTIYTLSMNLARGHRISTIITGLARGQLFETRLSDTFRARCFDPDTIDDWIKDARKAYHQIEDATTQLLDVKIFEDDRIFDEIQFLDFYRYTDIGLQDVYEYLTTQTVWQQPSDTGRSTNCLINDVGIYIHKRERGFHNYALPYSWDVRLGHKTRDMAMGELSDEFDMESVRRMLAEVGYDENDKLAQRGEKRLVAYFVAGGQLPPSDLRAFLAERLPDYMIPFIFIQLDSLPLTTNGKVDRSALPDPDQYRPDLETQYAAPTNRQEQAILQIWTDIFELPEIGIYDNFFDLGGDSIISIQIVARARQAGLRIAPSDIFQNQTVAELAAMAVDGDIFLAEQGPVAGDVPLTPIQRWFFGQGFAEPHYWNQSLWLDLPADIVATVFSSALQHLRAHHDSLRLRFFLTASGWNQMMPETSPAIPVHDVDLSKLPETEWELEMQQTASDLESGLDLGNGPLVQAALFYFGSDLPVRLFITVHHLAIDGVSWRPLLEDLERAYQQIRQGKDVILPKKSSSFKQWAERLKALSQKGTVAATAPYWKRNLAQNTLFADSGKQTTNSDAEVVNVALNVEDTRHLLQEISAAYNTNINEVLLTAATLTFTEDGRQEAFAFMLEGHGRDEEFVGQVDLSRTVGWFTSQYPITLRLPKDADLGSALKSVKEQLRHRPDDGISYGLARYLRSDLLSAEEHRQDVLFNYLGQFERSLPSSGFFSLARPLHAGFSPNNHLTHALIIDAYVWRDMLHLNWTFDPHRIASDLLQTLAHRFITHLEALISHCMAVESTEYTRSDFDLIDLDDERFDHLVGILNRLDKQSDS
jgi:amino acid adenylation domain-containing protein/non-ribosomal peptide synthase protein (TIGR01720 family)